MSPSATKGTRRKEDFYPTPYSCTKLLLDTLNSINENSIICEPFAGYGHISQIIKEYFPNTKLIQHELNENEELKKYGSITFGDYFKTGKYDENVTHVITNPPFSIAQECIEKCHENYPNAEIIMLLPLSLYGSIKRYEFWIKYPPNQDNILCRRPSFTGDGNTDSSVYSWIKWYNKGHINHNTFYSKNFLHNEKYYEKKKKKK